MTVKIRDELFKMQDLKYRDFQSKLIPNIDKDTMIGVRTPQLRNYAKQLIKNGSTDVYLNELPHLYFDENQLHAFILSEIKDFDMCISNVCRFLPYVDNWATCDQMSPKIFSKHHSDLIKYVKEWIYSEETYTVRFGIGMLMQHFLDDDFKPEYPDIIASLRSNEYYVNMMIAWYFATALSKQYDYAIRYIENHRLDTWTHNKSIQKAVESYRISPAQKEYLKSLKIKK